MELEQLPAGEAILDGEAVRALGQVEQENKGPIDEGDHRGDRVQLRLYAPVVKVTGQELDHVAGSKAVPVEVAVDLLPRLGGGLLIGLKKDVPKPEGIRVLPIEVEEQMEIKVLE